MNGRPPARSRWLMPTLAGYQRAWLMPDLVGGLSAGAVVIPQAMAYATIANLPVEVGLYVCIVPMLVYALLGGSKAMSVSTTSTVATLTATTLVSVGVAAGSDDALAALTTLTLLVGVALLIARVLRLGALVENISSATVLGLKIGVGATVALGQIPKMLGESYEFSGNGFLRALAAVGAAFGSIDLPTVALSAGSVLVLLLLMRFAPRVPATLIVLVAGIILVGVLHIDDLGVALIAPVPGGLPVPAIPDLSRIAGLVPGALAIAVMAFLESAAVARAIRAPSDPQIDADRELLAAGAANAAGAFFLAMPAAGGFSQSAVNQRAGSKSQASALMTVLLAMLVAVFLGPVLSLLPEATLASVVFVAVAGLINIPELIRWSRISPLDFWIAVTVALVGLATGLLAAVAAGVVITLILVLRELNTPRLDIVGRASGVLAVHVGRGLYTANARANQRAIVELATSQTETIHAIVLDLDRVQVMTITVLDALGELDRELAATGIRLHLASLPTKAAAIAGRVEWFRGLQEGGRVHPDVAAGLAAG